MELTERLNLREIHYLNSWTFSEFKQYAKSSCKNDDERKIQFNNLKHFCENNIKAKGEIKRLYAYTEKTPLEVGGRLFCGNSVQGLSKPIRGFLMKHTTDIDMKNAHPTILQYLCHKHQILCPNLEHYINYRDDVIREIPNGKTEFLKALNSNTINKKVKDKFFKDFDKEMKAIQSAIYKLPEYKHIIDSVPTKKTYNWVGSALNRIMCVCENKILQSVISVINHKGIEIASLMFDGLMVYGNYYEDLDLLTEIEERVNDDFEGLNMKFDYKPHNNDIFMPDDFEIPVKEELPPVSEGVWDDAEATNTLFKIYPHWVFCKDVLYVFDKDTGMWNSDHTSHLKVIQQHSDKLHILIKVDEKTVRTNKSYGNTLAYMEKLPTLIKTLCKNDNWLKQKQYSSLGKILFENGYYDFKEGKFYSKTEYGFNPDILFMGKIHHDYEPINVEYMESIKQRLFYDALGKEVGDYLIQNLARGLAGDMMKRILFGLGGTNCGKSILTTAVTLSCGDYIGSFNAENLAYRNTSNDEAQIMRWALLLRFKRIIFSNEMKSTIDLNGNMIKKISSGGDSLIGRNHCKSEEEFITHFLPVCLANDIPNIKPYDDAVDGRVRVISYKKEFVSEPENELQLKEDINIKEELKRLAFQKAFVGLLISYYGECNTTNEPVEVINAKKDWINEDKNVIETFKNDFEITNNDNDFVVSKTIEEWIKDKKLGITMKKFGMEMKKYTTIHKLDMIENKSKKINGKVTQVWSGVKYSEEVIE